MLGVGWQLEMGRTTRATLLVLALGACLVDPRLALGEPESDSTKWIATWTTALTRPSFVFENVGNYGFADKTLRQNVFTSAGGDAIRLRLSNRWGETPLVIGRAAIGRRHKPFNADLIPGHVVDVTFGGKRRGVIPPGKEILSDPVALHIRRHEVLAVDLYLPEATGPVAYNFLPNDTNFVADGDHTGTVNSKGFTALGSRYILKDVEVRTDSSAGVIVACCDSVSMTGQPGAHMRWPEILSRFLYERLGPNAPSVVQTNLSGQRLLTSFKYAESVLERFEKDVLTISGVKSVILFVGVNDLGVPQMPDIDVFSPVNDVSAAEMIEGFREVVSMARSKGIRIFGATITPGSGYVHRGSPYWSSAQEDKRREINAWLRETQIFDDVFEFAGAVQNPLDPEYYLPWASNDNIHPSDGGQYAIARAVNIDSLFAP